MNGMGSIQRIDAQSVSAEVVPSRTGERKRQAYNKAVLEARTRRRVILDEAEASTPAQKILAKQLARVRELQAVKQRGGARDPAEERTTVGMDLAYTCAKCGHSGASIECCSRN